LAEGIQFSSADISEDLGLVLSLTENERCNMTLRQHGLSGQRELCTIILTILLQNISTAQDAKTENATIEKVIHASIGWAKNKDFKLLYSEIGRAHV
jgi:hypothetical protein